jgi:hypothetical protein
MKKSNSSIFSPIEVPKNPGAEKWALLQFVENKNHVVVNYADGLGKTNEEDPIGSIDFSFGALAPGLPIEQYLQAVVSFHPLGEGNGKPLPLGLYIDCGSGYLWDRFVREGKDLLIRLFPRVLNSSNFEWAFYTFRDHPPKTLQFPLRVWYRGERARLSLEGIENASFRDGVVKEYGLQIEELSFSKRKEDPDILVIDDEDLFLRFVYRRRQPRLLIILSPVLRGFTYQARLARVNLLIIEEGPSPKTSEFIKSFFYEITHNENLLQAVRLAKERHQVGDSEVVLFASPATNDCLRIEDALNEFKKNVDVYASCVNPGRIDDFIKRHVGLTQLGEVFSGNEDLSQFFNYARTYSSSFNQESSGMQPMSYHHREFTAKKEHLDQIADKLKELVNNETFFKIFRKEQERRVNLTLDVLDWDLQYLAMSAYQDLLPGGQYRINVSIGQPLPDNLITGENPPIDPLLPDPDNSEGHTLEVVLFPKDFTLTSEAVQVLQLPLLGASDTVYFLLKAPAKSGEASLRVALFYKNHLLQAFLFQANVSEGYNWYDRPNTRATLDLSTTKKFTNLDKLGERDQYIGINGNGDGTHSIFLKGGTAKEISGLNESVLKEVQEGFAKQMEKTYFNEKNDPRFPLENLPGDKAMFEDAMRRLVRFGIKCYDQVFESNDREIKTMLSNLRDKDDLNIEIGRHELNYSFPWPLIYDYPLADEGIGQPSFPICYGEKVKEEVPANAKRPNGTGGCPHNPDLFTYCTHGFWGVRHRLEQLPVSELAMDGEEKPFPKEMRSILLCNNLTSTYTDGMEASLRRTNPDLLKADEGSNVLEMVFDGGKRPVNLVVVGHLETAEIKDDPPGERILTFPREKWKEASPIPAEKWILRRSILDYQKEGKFFEEPPLAIVFLISCCNAGMTVGSLGSLVRSFKSAGALAVVGTECDITPDLSARFVEDMMRYLYEEKITLGSAIRKFNESMINARIPLAFSFTCFGNNDVKLVN